MSRVYVVRQMTGCGLSIFWTGVIAFGFPGVMTAYWQERYHVGSAETGMVVSVMIFALAVCMFFSGRIHLKKGTAFCFGFGAVMMAASFLILLNASNIYMVYVWAFVTNIGGSFIYGPGLTTCQNVMPERRGTASGILNFIFGISAAVMSPVLNGALNHFGYERTVTALAICIVVSVMAAAMLVKESGSSTHRHENLQMLSAALPGAEGDLKVSEALRSKQFWLIWLVWMTMGSAGISMISLSKSYSIFLGLSGVTVLTAFNIANGGIRIFAGTIMDKVGGKWTGGIAFAVAASGYLMMGHCSSVITAGLCAVCVGIGFGTLFTISGPIISNIFGLRYFGMIFGLVFTGYGIIGAVVGPAMSGMILDHTGNNYVIVFSYLCAFCIIGTALLLAMNMHRIRKQNK